MWAIAFLAVDPRQVEEPYGSYVVIEGTYLVREDWAARTVGDLDGAGNRIAVAEAVPRTCT